jgi:hypothetical protein
MPVMLVPARAWSMPTVHAERYGFAVLGPFVLLVGALAGLGRRGLAVAAAADDITPFPSALAGRLRRPTYWVEENWRAYVLHGSGAPWRIVFDQWFSDEPEERAEELKRRGVIDKGMRPKVQSAVRALEEGVQRVHFIDGRLAHSLLLEIFTDKGIGTEIVLG